MKLYKWLLWNYCDYNIVAVLDETEEAELLARFGETAKTRNFYGQYFYLLNTRKRIISPSPSPALIISPHYDVLPIGKEIHKPSLNLHRYRIKKYSQRNDMSRQLLTFMQDLWCKICHKEY